MQHYRFGFRVTRAAKCGFRLIEHDEVGLAVDGPAYRDALAPTPDKSTTVESTVMSMPRKPMRIP